MLLSALLGVAGPLTGLPVAHAAEPCDQPLVVGVRGSGESPGYGDTVIKSVDAFNAVFGTPTDAVWLNYPAAGIGPVWLIKPWRAGEFAASVEDGVNELTLLLQTRASVCPGQWIALLGYSQGSLVINEVLSRLAANRPDIAKRIAAVGLVADPGRLGRSTVNAGTAASSRNGIAVSAGAMPKRDIPTSLRARVRSECLDGDIVCAFQGGDALIDGGAMHAVYKSSIAADLGSWAARRVRKRIPLPLVTAPPATAPPATAPPATSPPEPTFEIGSKFEQRCVVAWPTAPDRTSTAIYMRMTCTGVPTSEYQFVDVGYGDPNLNVTPSTGQMLVRGRVVDVAESGLGFKVLIVAANSIRIGS